MEFSDRVVLVAKTIIAVILILGVAAQVYYNRITWKTSEELSEFKESVQNTLGTHSQAIVTLGQKAGFDWTLGPRQPIPAPVLVPTQTPAPETETPTTDAP